VVNAEQPGPAPGDLPGADAIMGIADIGDNDLRAHKIALTYFQLAQALDTRLRANQTAADPFNANWFHFAMWGTLTVSGNIGNDRAPQRLNSGVAAPLRRRLTPAVLRAKAADGQLIGRALAWGQRLIFLSTCLAMAEHLCRSSPTLTAEIGARADRYGEALETVSQQQIASPAGQSVAFHWLKDSRHRGAIRRAIDLYKKAETAEGPDKAKLILGANVMLTAVEQDLVDPALTTVVGLVPRRAMASMDWRMARLAPRQGPAAAHRLHRPADAP
jgi:hypothetical protein